MNRIIERKTTSYKYRMIKQEDRKQIIRHKEEAYKDRNNRSRREASEDRGRISPPVRENNQTRKPIERQGSEDRKKPDYTPNEQRESQDKDYKRRTDLINSNEGSEIESPARQVKPDTKTIERQDRRVPTERKGRDFVPSDRRKSDAQDDQTRTDSRSFEGNELEAPVVPVNTVETPEVQAPVVRNSPDEINSGRSRTAYPRPVRSEEVRERTITPSVQGNVTESVQREKQNGNQTKVRRPTPQIVKKYTEERKKNMDSSEDREAEEVRKETPIRGRVRR